MTDLREALMPWLWLATVAFLTGFVSYLALGAPAAAEPRRELVPSVASAPISDAWNLPKRI